MAPLCVSLDTMSLISFPWSFSIFFTSWAWSVLYCKHCGDRQKNTWGECHYNKLTNWNHTNHLCHRIRRHIKHSTIKVPFLLLYLFPPLYVIMCKVKPFGVSIQLLLLLQLSPFHTAFLRGGMGRQICSTSDLPEDVVTVATEVNWHLCESVSQQGGTDMRLICD